MTTAFVMCGLWLGAVAAPASATAAVPAGRWVDQVCTALVPFDAAVGRRLEGLHLNGTPAEVRRRLLAFLDGIEHRTDRAAALVGAAGVPDVRGGAGVERATLRALDGFEGAVLHGIGLALLIPAGSSADAAGTAAVVSSQIRRALTAFGRDLGRTHNRQLAAAAEHSSVCRALVARQPGTPVSG